MSKTAPMQGYPEPIPWEVHLRIYEGYAKKHGTRQTAARLAERGGFSTGEGDMFYPTWREHIEWTPRLRAQIELLEEKLAGYGNIEEDKAYYVRRLNTVNAQNKELEAEIERLEMLLDKIAKTASAVRHVTAQAKVQQ